jgi:hypothetical protein
MPTKVEITKRADPDGAGCCQSSPELWKFLRERHNMVTTDGTTVASGCRQPAASIARS